MFDIAGNATKNGERLKLEEKAKFDVTTNLERQSRSKSPQNQNGNIQNLE